MLVRIWYAVLLCVFPVGAMAAEANPPVSGLVSYSMPHFPAGLRGIMSGDGEAVLAITIDAQGDVADSVALLATNVDFAREALRAVDQWKFSTVGSGTWPRREIVEFNFSRADVVTSLSHAEAARQGFASTTAYRQIQTVQEDQLDGALERIAGTMPTVSKSVLDAHSKQAIVVNFVIDTEGKVRVPVVYGSLDSQLADAVLTAISTWRYTPSIYQNKPVLVEVTRAIVLDDTSS